MNENKNNISNMEGGIAELKAIRMTPAERAEIKSRLDSVIAKATIPARRPWHIRSMDFQDARYSLTWSIATLVLLLGGGVALAGHFALPGDIAYPVKVGLIEPIQGAFEGTGSTLATWQASLVDTRLSEAESLATAGKLDDQKTTQIENLLDAHTTALAESLQVVQKTDSPAKANLITATVEATMKIHAKVLDEITAEASTTATSTAKAPTARNKITNAKNSQAVVHLQMEADVHSHNLDIPWAAPRNAEATTTMNKSAAPDIVIQNYRDNKNGDANAAVVAPTMPDVVPGGVPLRMKSI